MLLKQLMAMPVSLGFGRGANISVSVLIGLWSICEIATVDVVGQHAGQKLGQTDRIWVRNSIWEECVISRKPCMFNHVLERNILDPYGLIARLYQQRNAMPWDETWNLPACGSWSWALGIGFSDHEPYMHMFKIWIIMWSCRWKNTHIFCNFLDIWPQASCRSSCILTLRTKVLGRILIHCCRTTTCSATKQMSNVWQTCEWTRLQSAI